MILASFVVVCLCIQSVIGISRSDVFEYNAQQGTASLLGIQLLDQADHRITRRDISDPNATISGPATIIKDNHLYYNRTVYISHPLSVFYSREFDRIFAKYSPDTNVHLNNGRNLALPIPLKFKFDFYGHPVQSIVVTTGGFLYVNEITHSYLAFSQYIAPLMADFETKSSVSSIKYVEVENAFWVRWENMLLMKKHSVGNFSFQCAFFTNGSIVFDYISIPISMPELKAATKTLSVGLSDAFYYDVQVPGSATVMRKIVKYHEVVVPLDHVVTDGVIQFAHLPTCNQQATCQDCTNKSKVSGFNCSWCYELGRCSSGVDRQLQEWHDAECHYLGASGSGDCSEYARQQQQSRQRPSAGRIVLGVCIGLLSLAALASALGVLVYGYRNPDSRIGACLIRNRPAVIRERLFGSGGGGGGGGGGSGYAYKIGGDKNPYVNFSNT